MRMGSGEWYGVLSKPNRYLSRKETYNKTSVLMEGCLFEWILNEQISIREIKWIRLSVGISKETCESDIEPRDLQAMELIS